MKCFYIWKNTMSNFIPTCVVQLDHINVQCVEGQWKLKNNMLVTGIFYSFISRSQKWNSINGYFWAAPLLAVARTVTSKVLKFTCGTVCSDDVRCPWHQRFSDYEHLCQYVGFLFDWQWHVIDWCWLMFFDVDCCWLTLIDADCLAYCNNSNIVQFVCE